MSSYSGYKRKRYGSSGAYRNSGYTGYGSMGAGTRYYSTRKTPGLVRTPARYSLRGRARRFGKERLKQALYALAEHKFFDTVSEYPTAVVPTTTGVTTDGKMFCITDVMNGSTDVTRIGDKCTGTSLQIRFNIDPPLVDDQAQTIMWRVVVFIWKDDTDPIIGDILLTTASRPITPPLAFLNHDKKIKRKILYDKTFSSVSSWDNTENTITGSENGNIYRDVFIPLKGQKNRLNIINYQAGGTTGVNKIWVLLVNNVTPADIAKTWQITIGTRYNFIDM